MRTSAGESESTPEIQEREIEGPPKPFKCWPNELEPTYRACVARGVRHGLLLGEPLVLVAVVLEPDLDLRRGQVDEAGQVLPLGRGEVLLRLEASLQLVDLRINVEMYLATTLSPKISFSKHAVPYLLHLLLRGHVNWLSRFIV